MGPLKSTLNKQAKRRGLLVAMYSLITPGVEITEFSDFKLAELVGIPGPTAANYVEDFRSLGIVTKRFAYQSGGNALGGRTSNWTVNCDLEEALRRLDSLSERENRMHAKRVTAGAKQAAKTRNKNREARVVHDGLAVEKRNGEPVAAIAGPDAASPFTAIMLGRKANDAKALVEAARQYRDRDKKLRDSIESLVATAKELGITVPIDDIQKMIVLEEDERLAAVALVLPYIEDLEYAVEMRAAVVPHKRADHAPVPKHLA